MILWYSKWKDIERDVSIDTLSTVSDVSRQHCICYVSPTPVKQLVAGVDSRCQKTDRVWYLALKNFKIPNSSASVYCTSRSKSPPTAAKSKFKFTSRIRSRPRPPRGAESSDWSDIRRKSWLRFPSSWQSDTGWKLIRRYFSCQMELGAKPQLTYGGRRLVAAGASDADFNEAL